MAYIMELSSDQMELIAMNDPLLTRVRHACPDDIKICLLKLEQDMGWCLCGNEPEVEQDPNFTRLYEVLEILDTQAPNPVLIQEMITLTAAFATYPSLVRRADEDWLEFGQKLRSAFLPVNSARLEIFREAHTFISDKVLKEELYEFLGQLGMTREIKRNTNPLQK